jgi:kindlin 2
MAAFRLASKGRSIGESSYETERESILALLNMQRPSSSNHHQTKFDIQPENFVSTKFVKKYKTKQVSSQDDHFNNRISSDPYRIPIEIRPDSTKIL